MTNVKFSSYNGQKEPMKHLSLSEIRAVCQKPNYKTVGNWMVRTFLRDAAVPCTWLFLRLQISANVTTCLAIATAFFAGIFLAVPGAIFFLCGAVLLQIWYYLDHVDGQIARCLGTASMTGRFFDYAMHHFVHGWVFFGSGLFLYFSQENCLYLFGAGVSGLIIVMFNLTHDIKYKTFFEYNERAKRGESVVTTQQNSGKTAEEKKWLLKRAFSLVHKLNEIHVFMNLITITAVLDLIWGGSMLRTILGFFYLCSGLLLTFLKYYRVIVSRSVDKEFQVWFLENQ